MWSWEDRKSTRLNSSHVAISYAVFCLKTKNRGLNIFVCFNRQNRRTEQYLCGAVGLYVCHVELSPQSTDLLLATVSFFFNDTATTEIYTLSLHDALPI